MQPFTCPPEVFTQGDTVIFQTFNTLYPASIWTLNFVLSREGTNLASVTGMPTGPTGNDFLVTIGAGTTAEIQPGRAKWTMLVSSAGLRYYNGSGYLTIVPDPTQNLVQTVEMLALANIKTQIANAVNTLSITRNFNSQSSTDKTLKDMMDARDRLQVIVDAQLIAIGAKDTRNYKRIINYFE